MNKIAKIALTIPTIVLIIVSGFFILQNRELAYQNEQNNAFQSFFSGWSNTIDSQNLTITNLTEQLSNKTSDYNALKDAFAIYCNCTIINLDSSWTKREIQPYTVENRFQGIDIVSYTNGTYLAAQIYFEDSKVWSPAVLVGHA